jgi:hypothetical protein
MIDTLRFAETLEQKGKFQPEQARALSQALAAELQAEVPSRADLDRLETNLKAEMGLLRRDIEGLRRDMETFYWKTIAAVAAMLLANLGAVWAIVASYASRGG